MGTLFRLYADRTYLKFPQPDEQQERLAYDVPLELIDLGLKHLPAPDEDDPE